MKKNHNVHAAFWMDEIEKDLKRKPLKKDAYDFSVRIINATNVSRSICCHRKAHKLIVFAYHDRYRRKISRLFGVCRTHFSKLHYEMSKFFPTGGKILESFKKGKI